MRTCAHVKEGGERCRSRAMNGSDYCYGHDPAKATERSASAKKAGKVGGRGRAKPLSEEIAELKRYVRGLISGVHKPERITVRRDGVEVSIPNPEHVPRGTAIAMNQLMNTLVRMIEVERKAHETEELDALLEEMKEKVNEAERRKGRGFYAR